MKKAILSLFVTILGIVMMTLVSTTTYGQNPPSDPSCDPDGIVRTWTLVASPMTVANNGTVDIYASGTGIASCENKAGVITVQAGKGTCVTTTPSSRSANIPSTGNYFYVGSFTVTNTCGGSPQLKMFRISSVTGGHSSTGSVTVTVNP